MLDEAVDFFQRFIQAEYEMAVAAYSEPDSQRYARKLEAFEQLLKGVRTRDARVRGVDDLELGILGDDWFETGKRILERYRPRTLFQVKHYTHSELGDLFRAYVSEPDAFMGKAYSASFYATQVEDTLRVISLYFICDECEMTGTVQGAPCPECQGTGWRFMEGRRIGPPGTLVGVRKLQPPSRPEQLKEYEAE